MVPQNNLTSIVSDLELCKKIPLDCFSDSALVWNAAILNNPVVEERLYSELGRHALVPKYAAPTFDEIFKELAAGDENFESFDPELTYDAFMGGWIVSARNKKIIDGFVSVDYLRETDKDKPVTAALKLWLSMKGLIDEHK